MEVCEQNEAWVETDGDYVFSHTKIILRNGDQYFYATSTQRYQSIADVNLIDLKPIPIPTSKIWPEFPKHFTRAPEPLPGNCYVKRPSLLYYGDTVASTELGDLTLHEAEVCEILRASPHPNIAEYLGCVVERGRIKGLCFLKYDMTLSQRVAQARPFSAGSFLQYIKEGIQHLHSLDLIHCDLNPNNILMRGEIPAIGDFDSCRRRGEKLGLKAGTIDWTREEFKFALPENDQYGLSKIQEFLIREARKQN
ncbi:MAPK/MAK/MRK overlapping kinase [Lachnellula occidentalis]|uniref:MAPK/MAK/MRK overlapping kinase n=1 Tax=Lachnellula occidentalis TaxID=215460 RepID=A0A8H8REA8_9HELO|nr:MAPK/MAK/MRK overlapping kinase [Lachnellula occidentalis]